jgi:guanosine-3',5'-bis(diphosphate) 3'-pyrophosphohydrolase
MHQIYRELEDRAFEVLNPHRATILRKAIDTATKGRKRILSKIEKSIKEKLKENDLIGDVVGRQKHLYGIFKKMRRQAKPLSEVLDVYAFKITVESAMDCYKALGVLHNAFSPIEGRFKDYIAIPKSNSYQSLHTGVITFDGLPVEIQIRTSEMDELAEFGIAAHWLYKSGEEKDSPVQARARRWVNNLVEIQKNTENSRDFVEIIKTGLVPNEIYVFTPKGRIIELPKGSTPLDFAFMVHSDVGLHCRGCRINKNLAPLSVPLESGQTVEIITDDIPQAQPSWLEMVVTSRARSAIRHQLKNLRSSEARKFGKKLLENSLMQHNLKLRSIPKSRMSKLLDSLKVKSLNDLLQQIGLGIRPSNFVANQIMQAIDFDSPSLIESSNLQISGSEGLLVNYGPCCKPIPGDPVVAHFTAGRGMVIHQERCKNILPIKDDPALCAPVQWEDDIDGNFSAELVVTTQDRPGILAEISSAISEMNKNIEGIRGETPAGNQVQLFLIIEVSGRDDLAKVMKALKKTKNVISVNRVHSSEDRKLRIR